LNAALLSQWMDRFSEEASIAGLEIGQLAVWSIRLLYKRIGVLILLFSNLQSVHTRTCLENLE
jgi:hypothetical protein